LPAVKLFFSAYRISKTADNLTERGKELSLTYAKGKIIERSEKSDD
jgi:hypothetical protein